MRRVAVWKSFYSEPTSYRDRGRLIRHSRCSKSIQAPLRMTTLCFLPRAFEFGQQATVVQQASILSFRTGDSCRKLR